MMVPTGEARAEPTEWVGNAEVEALLSRLPELMRSTDQSLAYALAVLERVACQGDDEGQTKALLRVLALHATPHPALTRQLVEVIGCHESPAWLVEVAAQLCDAGEEGINMVVEQYKELLSRDRAFLVPVIGSLGELPLPTALKGQVLSMMQESLSIVEETDVPTVIRALLASLSPSTRASIVRTLRQHASSLPASSLPLVVELIGSALRADGAAAAAYLQAVRRDRAGLSSLDVAILVVLGSRRGDRGSVHTVVLSCIRTGTLRPEAVRAAIGAPAASTRQPAGVSAAAATVQLLDMSYTPTWLALVESLARQASAGEERVAAVVVAVYTALFSAHVMARSEIVGALLRASIAPPMVALQTAAARAAQGRARARGEDAARPPMCGMVADSASQALVALGSSELLPLSDHAHLMEEAIYHVAGERLAYERLCAVLGAVAGLKDGLLGNLLVFCRKHLFSAVDGMQRAALTLATHIIHQPAGVSDEDRAALLGLALGAITKQRSLGGAVVELCDLLTYNLGRFGEAQIREAFEQTLLPTLQREASGGAQAQRQQPGGSVMEQLVEVGPASHHVDLLGGAGSGDSGKSLRLVTSQWVGKYHPQVAAGMGATPGVEWVERRPQILPALIRTYAVVGHRLGQTPDPAHGAHLCRYFVPACAVRMARRGQKTDADEGSTVTVDRVEAAEVAWCCVYTASAARAALAAVSVADEEQELDREEQAQEACTIGVALRSLSFSYRWLRAAEAAAEELEGWGGDEEASAVRTALLALPALPRGLLSRVLAQLVPAFPATEGSGAHDEDRHLHEYLLHCIHDQLLREAETTLHAWVCRWASRGDRTTGVSYGCAKQHGQALLTEGTDETTIGGELGACLAGVLVRSLERYSRLAADSLHRMHHYAGGAEARGDDSDDTPLDVDDEDCVDTCGMLCTIWRLLAVALEVGSRSTRARQAWMLCLARAVLRASAAGPAVAAAASAARTAEAGGDGQEVWAHAVLFAYVGSHFALSAEPHAALLSLDVLVSLSRAQEAGSGNFNAIAQLYGRFMQTTYTHTASQLGVRLPRLPLVALLCASIRGHGRGESVADRWSAGLLKMCNAPPKLTGGINQCEKRLAHHALLSLSALVSTAAAATTASTGGVVEMLPVATDLLGCVETFLRQDGAAGSSRSLFVLPAITPLTLPLFVDHVLRVAASFDQHVKPTDTDSSSSSSSSHTPTSASASASATESLASLGTGLRLRQRLGFVLWELELAGVAGGWSASSAGVITRRYLRHLAVALPAVRKRLQKEVLPAIGRNAGGADLCCGEVVSAAAALVAQLRRLCGLVKTREQERGVRLSQRSAGKGRAKYQADEEDDDEDDAQDDDELTAAPAAAAATAQATNFSVPQQRKRSRAPPAATSGVGAARRPPKWQLRRLVHEEDESLEDDDADLDVADLGGEFADDVVSETDEEGEEQERREADEEAAEQPAAAAAPRQVAAAPPTSARRSAAGRSGRRGHSLLSRVTYAVASLAELLLSAPPQMRTALLEADQRHGSSASPAADATNERSAGVVAAPDSGGSASKLQTMLSRFLEPPPTGSAGGATVASGGTSGRAGGGAAATDPVGAVTSAAAAIRGRDEAVRAANAADGYDSSDSDDADGLGGMGRRGRIAKPRPAASADAFRAVPRLPVEPVKEDAKAAALAARLGSSPSAAAAAAEGPQAEIWGHSPDPRR